MKIRPFTFTDLMYRFSKKKVFPLVRFIHMAVTLRENFPEWLLERAPEDHRRLREVFAFAPTSFRDAARARYGIGDVDSERAMGRAA